MRDKRTPKDVCREARPLEDCYQTSLQLLKNISRVSAVNE